MTDIEAGVRAEPDGAPRIASLDVLRGIAILGILFMNINDMGGSLWTLFANDIRHFGWSTADQVAWFLREVIANGTARCMLEMLFGAGMVILTDRIADGAAGWSVMRRYYWRNAVLFLFGVVHVFILLWPGDILHTYGMAAMVAFLFRRLSAKWLLPVGLLMAMTQVVGGGIGYYTVSQTRAEAVAIRAKEAAGGRITAADRKLLGEAEERRRYLAKVAREDAAKIAAEDKARTGTFATWARAAWDGAVAIQQLGLEIVFVVEAASTMLIGAALYKLGVIQGDRSRRFYLIALVAGYTIGMGARAIGALDEMRFDDAPSIMWSLNEVARLATTLGHIAAVQLLLGSAMGARLLKPFVAVGRTALSIYIMQTLICLWVLYPPQGLALYGTQGWAAFMLTALAVNAVLVVVANWYVRHYRIAPVEWAWRSIIERRRLPFRMVR